MLGYIKYYKITNQHSNIQINEYKLLKSDPCFYNTYTNQISNIDQKTSKILSDNIMIDKNYVYLYTKSGDCMILNGIDSKTFQVLSKDRKSVV